MTFPSITTAPSVPNRLTMSEDEFVAACNDFVEWWTGLPAQLSTYASDLIQVASTASYSSASGTTLSVGLGVKELVIDPGLLYVGGQDVKLSSAAAPTALAMYGVVTEYDITTGDISVDVTAVVGSGSANDWLVALSGLRGATGNPDAGGTDVQVFTSSGTWTKPTNGVVILVEVIGGGGGGGSGQRQGTPTYGGLGGGGGGYNYNLFVPGDLSSSETVTIGAGGTGGASKTTNGAGNSGTSGGNTTFGSQLTGYGGSGGTGGTGSMYGTQPRGGGAFSAGAVDSGGEPLNIYDTGVQHGHFGAGKNYATTGALDGAASGWGGGNGGSSTSSSPAAGKGGCSVKGGCGGGMGGFYDGAALQQPAAGGSRTGVSGGGGAAGTSHATTAVAGTTPTTFGHGGGGGGGTSGAGAGASGGNGAAGGGGGGGGGGTASTQDSGAGGNGGGGYCRVVTFLQGE